MRVILTVIFTLWAVAASAATLIDAQVTRNQTGTGETFISSGFPFPPGLVTETMIRAGTIKVIVDSSEVAANVTALRGRHSDGSVRSALIQFSVESMAEGATLTASVQVDNGERTYSDPAYVRPTATIVLNNNVILPTDPDYIVTTMVAFQHLLVEGDGTADEEAQYTALAEDRFDALVSSGTEGSARYDKGRAMVALWSRSGDIKYYNEAVSSMMSWLAYNTPGSSADPDCKSDEYVNPDARTPNSETTCGLPAEWMSPVFYSYASMYLLTGYRDYWSALAYLTQNLQRSMTDQTTTDAELFEYGVSDHPRMNYANKYGGMLAAYAIDATMPINGQWFAARHLNFEEQFGWMLNSVESQVWAFEWIPFDTGSGTVPAIGTEISQGAVTADLLGVYEVKFEPVTAAGEDMPVSGYLMVENRSGGSFAADALTGISASATGAEETDYRAGFVGTQPNSPRTTASPVFQSAFVLNWLIDYYLFVDADSRIPPIVKTNLDIVLNNFSLLVSGDQAYGNGNEEWGYTEYGTPYYMENPVSTDTKSPYLLPEFPRIIAFVLATGEAESTDTVNSATYATWYTRCIDTANNSDASGVLTWEWKNFGQYYGFSADTGWLNAQPSFAAPTFREPTYYGSIPGDTPDIYREQGSRLEHGSSSLGEGSSTF